MYFYIMLPCTLIFPSYINTSHQKPASPFFKIISVNAFVFSVVKFIGKDDSF